MTTGFLEICKEADPTGEAYTDTFSFTIAGRPGTVSAPADSCAGLIQVAAGAGTITEVPPRARS